VNVHIELHKGWKNNFWLGLCICAAFVPPALPVVGGRWWVGFSHQRPTITMDIRGFFAKVPPPLWPLTCPRAYASR
jgi:hypothetical protein